MDAYLPARYSMNTFFVRHVAKPKRMIHIEGLNRAPICAVNDEGYLPFSTHKSTFPPNNFNEGVIRSHNGGSLDSLKLPPRKKEKVLPPGGQFQAYGIIDDTDRWKDELNSLAASVGLLTQTDIEKAKRQKERERYIRSLQQEAVSKPATSSGQPTSPKKPSSSYSLKTSRLNEPLPTGRRTSRGSQASRGMSQAGHLKYIVDENDREVWMLQVLCQILQTDSLVDVQSWLVSSNQQEKEKVRGLIDQAMKGLESTGRIDTTQVREFMTPKTTEVKPKENEQEQGAQATQVNLDKIQNMIEKMSLKSASLKNEPHRFSRHMSGAASNSGRRSVPPVGSHAQNVYRLPEIAEYVAENERSSLLHSQASVNNEKKESRPLEPIKEDATVFKLADTTEYKAPLSPVFNINIYPTPKGGNTVEKSETPALSESTVIKVEAPAKDFKIEELNVTMVVKDEKSQTLQKINGNWKPESSIPKEKQEN